MKQDAHLIDIESIVLNGVDMRYAARVQAMVEAEVLRTLGGAGLGDSLSETSLNQVCSEIGRSVAKGGTNGS